MNLAEFVDLQMKAKGLTRLDIERNSGKMVTDTHVNSILKGKSKNPTLKILLGLAKGLDVHPVEVFKAAAEVDDPEDKMTAEELIRLNQKMLKLKPAEMKRVKKILNKE